MRAILFGATGMVGEGVLLQALRDDDVASVLVVGRRPCLREHPKLKELLHRDFLQYSDVEDQLGGYDACFFCLGVSSIGMKEPDYRRITYEFTMEAAKTLSRRNPQMVFCYISGAGTDSSEEGRSMWARVKGKTENDLAKLPFKAVYCFRPGLMKPAAGQRNVKPVMRLLGSLYPLFRAALPKYVCTLEELGQAMIESARSGDAKRVLENDDIRRLARLAAARRS